LDNLDEEIIKLIQEQLTEGKRGDGSTMPKYTTSTKQSKLKRGTILMGERIALIDTGEFWKSMFANIYDGSIIVDSKDWKRDMLVDRYGDEIFLISKTQMEYLASLVNPLLNAKIKQFLENA